MENPVLDQVVGEDIAVKKEAIQAKIANRNESRLLKNEEKKKSRDQLKTADEQSDLLLKQMKDQLTQLEENLRQEFPVTTDKKVLMGHFDDLTKSLQLLQNFYNESYSFLPPYNARNYQARLSDLKSGISRRREELLPKKKFAFKSKKKTASLAVKKDENRSRLDDLTRKAAAYSLDSFEIKNKNDETISMTGESIKGRDISITDLKGCKVILHGSPGTVHICNSQDCHFEIGPVSGSVFVDKCSNCKISTGCQQLRIHHTKNTEFRVHVTSRSIIEDTHDVRFGAYDVDYDGIKDDFLSSRLDQNTNNWKSVDDFNWLAMDSASPNWSLIQ